MTTDWSIKGPRRLDATAALQISSIRHLGQQPREPRAQHKPRRRTTCAQPRAPTQPKAITMHRTITSVWPSPHPPATRPSQNEMTRPTVPPPTLDRCTGAWPLQSASRTQPTGLGENPLPQPWSGSRGTLLLLLPLATEPALSLYHLSFCLS
jgi:hypothetical protein